MTNPRRRKRKQKRRASPETVEYLDLERRPSTFRVLELLPASNEQDPLVGVLHTECHLDVGDSSGVAPYEAISYCWGKASTQPPQFSRQYLISIQRRDLSLTPNLDAALRVFRHPDRARRLWADAICINQADKREQTHQVSMMSHIYHHASRTLAWVSDSEYEWEPDDLLFKNLAILDSRPLHMNPWDFLDQQIYFPGLFMMYTRNTIEPLVCLPYFERRWVLQEIGVAKEVEFWHKRHRIGGLELARAVEILVETGDWDKYVQGMRNTGFTRLLLMGSSSLGRVRGCPPARSGLRILDALDDHHASDCMDPRDRISAMMWLFPSGSDFTVDYLASVGEVYLDFARTILELSNDTARRLLASAASRAWNPTTGSALPSWAPDWRIRPAVSYVSLQSNDNSTHGTFVTILKLVEQSSVQIAHTPEGQVRLRINKFQSLRRVYDKSDPFNSSSNGLYDDDDSKDLASSLLRSGDYIMDLASERKQNDTVRTKPEGAVVLRQHGEAWKIVRAVSFYDFDTPWDEETVSQSHMEFIIE